MEVVKGLRHPKNKKLKFIGLSNNLKMKAIYQASLSKEAENE